MKILYLHQYFNTPEMGGSTRSFEIARRLVEAGHQVNMVTSWRNPDKRLKPFVSYESGIRVCWIPIEYSNKMGYYPRIKAFLSFAMGATKQALKIDSDLIFATSTPLTVAIPAIVGAKIRKIPFVFEVRDLWPEVPIALGTIKNPFLIKASEFLAKLTYNRARHIIALAPGMKERIEELCPGSEVTVIPNGCDFAIFASKFCQESLQEDYPWLKNKKVVLYPGTLGDVNNVEYLVSCAEEVAKIDSGIIFVVIGDGKKRALVKKLAEEKGIERVNFFLLNELPKNDIVKWFQVAKIIAVFYKAPECAVKNSTQNKFFDSLASGKPVLFEHNGWSVNLLESLGGALFIPPDNPKSASIKIVKALNDNSWLQKAGKASRELGEREFSRDNQVRLLEGIFIRILRKF